VSATPTSIEPILGWRVWHVEPGAACLRSWAQTADWPAGEKLEAGCRSRLGLRWRLKSHGAPDKEHECGIYACRERAEAEQLIRDLDEIAPLADRFPTAIGRVSLWGRVIENTGGWRAEFAYPYDLELYGGDEQLAAALRRRYAVDVALA
jgi:hypothetical protein